MNNTEYILNANKITQVFYAESGESLCVARDLDIGVREGEFLSIVGPSGCGKTTIIRILSGLLVPTSGSVVHKGQDVTGRTSMTRGVVFQADAVFPWMTVGNNISYGPRMRGCSKQEVEKITDYYIKLVGLDGFKNAFPKELSGGMRKRVDIARAYANRPEILLMDEPFGSLDSQTKANMQTELLQIWNEDRKTVIFITHDLEEALYLSDRVVVLTPRPSKIYYEIAVDLPRPRSSTVKTSAEFTKLRAHLELMLAEAIQTNQSTVDD